RRRPRRPRPAPPHREVRGTHRPGGLPRHTHQDAAPPRPRRPARRPLPDAPGPGLPVAHRALRRRQPGGEVLQRHLPPPLTLRVRTRRGPVRAALLVRARKPIVPGAARTPGTTPGATAP